MSSEKKKMFDLMKSWILLVLLDDLMGLSYDLNFRYGTLKTESCKVMEYFVG